MRAVQMLNVLFGFAEARPLQAAHPRCSPGLVTLAKSSLRGQLRSAEPIMAGPSQVGRGGRQAESLATRGPVCDVTGLGSCRPSWVGLRKFTFKDQVPL